MPVLLALLFGGVLAFLFLKFVIFLFINFPKLMGTLCLLGLVGGGGVIARSAMTQAAQAREQEARQAALVQAQATTQAAATTTVQAINLSGTWSGVEKGSSGTAYNLTMELSQTGTRVSGFLRSANASDPASFALLQITGTLNGTIFTSSDQRVLDQLWPNNGTTCIGDVTLRYTTSLQGRPTLDGTWASKMNGCGSSQLSLTRGESAQGQTTPLAAQAATIQAINLSGTWRGTLTHFINGQGNATYNQTLEIKQDGSAITGVRRTSDPKAPSDYGLLEITGSLNGAILVYSDQRILEERWPNNGTSCIATATLRYSTSAQGTPALVGTWTSQTRGCTGGQVILTR